MKKKLCMIYNIVFVFLCAQIFLFSQTAKEATPVERGSAEQEFRRGVQAWYRGAFNDAVIQFEKALSYLPSENLILDWLGKAYYRSGIEGAALQQWKLASQAGYGGLLLENKIDIVQNRRVPADTSDMSLRFTESGIFPGKTASGVHFSQPLSLLPQKDGSILLIAYGSNEILQLDVNGLIINRIRGPLSGFDRPMDILRQANGNLLVSEYAGDRICQLDPRGRFIKYFGSKGRGAGQLVGPQFLAQDASGNVYVSDYGNGRVTVFDSEGEALFFFGTFISPAGIAVADDRVYIADAGTGAVTVYDTAGNYLDTLTEHKTLRHPETLRVHGSFLMAADTNKILAIDRHSGAAYEIARTGNAPVKLTCADVDSNGNIVAADFKNNEVIVLSRMHELVGGLFVQVERVYADDFPRVSLDVRVENRSRKPIIGLKDVNFLITEEKRPAAEQKLIGGADYNDVCDISLIIDRSYDSAQYRQEIDTAVREIAAAMKGRGTLRIVSAGKVPVPEYEGNPALMEKFSSANLKAAVSPTVAVDLAVRLAANDLINAEPKRAVVYITAGGPRFQSFGKYGLTDVSSYLNNNGIAFLSLSLDRQNIAEEIEFLVKNTPGGHYYIFRTAGISSVVRDIIDIPCPVYRFSYVSSLPTNFGRAFLPVEVETYVLNRSGRDETGYFAPLE
ncbi:hypothetical protein H0R92_08645 [Treponema sp. OMZ 840]|uniref:NHL repeat-containing protein n=1 Tax=Treponema sp. OMZ 840 TaxID=244313 RepID=UPI003D8F6D9D